MSRPVAELQRVMSAQEFGYWKVIDNRAPIGLERIDRAAAAIQATLANIHRDRDARPEPFAVADFMPFKPPVLERAEQDDVALSRQLRSALSGVGKKRG